jgi:hypothetical protein
MPDIETTDHEEASPREEFLGQFRSAHAALHRLWSDAVGKEGYDKAAWRELDNALARFARDASEKHGVGRSEPLPRCPACAEKRRSIERSAT